MANTVIQLKRSGNPGNVPNPGSLSFGELSLNYADGNLFYKSSAGQIRKIGDTSYTYSTIIANSSVLLASSPSDILTINSSDAIKITSNVQSDTITIGVDRASTNNFGVTKIYDGVDSNSVSLAASANSVNSVDKKANTALNLATDAYYLANAVGGGVILEVYALANIAYQTANIAYTTANLAYQTIDIGPVHNTANLAYSRANAAYTLANSGVMASAAYATANAAYKRANTAIELIANTVAAVHVSDVAPSNLKANSLWWDSSSGKLKVYYYSGTAYYWVDAFINDTSVHASAITGILGADHGGTGIVGSYSKGDIIYSSNDGYSLTKLNIGSNNQIMVVANGVPSWADISSINNRITQLPDGSPLTLNVDTSDIAEQINTQAEGMLYIDSPTGTPINGQKITLRVKSSNTQTLSFHSGFKGSIDLPLPLSTSGNNKIDYLDFMYCTIDSKWHLISKVFGF